MALPAPSDREKSQMYLQRYLQHLPAAGEIKPVKRVEVKPVDRSRKNAYDDEAPMKKPSRIPEAY